MSLIVPASRFALVGIAATLLHITLAIFLIEKLALSPGAANGIAYVLANMVSYIANTQWSFKSQLGLETWGRFVAVSAFAWGLTVGIASAVDRLGGHYLLGIGLVVSLVPVLSFFAHRCFTYR